MNLYDLPEIKIDSKFKDSFSRFFKKQTVWIVILSVFVSSIFGFLAGSISGIYFSSQIENYLAYFGIKTPSLVEENNNAVKPQQQTDYIPQTSQEQAIIKAVKDVSPAVVSVVISKNAPAVKEQLFNPFEDFEKFFGPLPPEFQIPQNPPKQKETEKQKIGEGSGFIISPDGVIATNKHVVLEKDAEYTVFTNDGRKFSAKVLARDPVQDLGILKIDQEKTVDGQGGMALKLFPFVQLGDSSNLQIGQTVIAIGNALGEFRNTVSVGVISGLGRTVTASGGGLVETLEDIIQTDAAINKGNSGGPLLNLKGEVIGINTAMALDAQSIGFAIPINKAKKGVEQIRSIGKIVYPFLGVRYVLVNEKVKSENNLSVDYGAFVAKGDSGEPAVTPGSAAERAGLKEGDVILELDSEKITQDNSLAKIIQKHSPEDKISLKILRGNKEMILSAVLGERTE